MKEKLEKFSDEKLIDIVKNYIQYGYSENLRNETIEILQKRGITKEMLSLQGNLNNLKYNDSESLYNEFLKFSKITFITYLAILFLNIFNSIIPFTSVLILLCLILYFVFLIKSFISQEKFYKSIQKERNNIEPFIYFFLGMPLYFLMYFYYRNLMKSELKNIR
ncbi:hypothetical protein [Wenyingzhuangia sp. IMCC45467]